MATVDVTADALNARFSLAFQFASTVTAVKIERRDPGAPWVTIRAGSSVATTAGAGSADDYEAPLDSLVQYRLTQVAPAGAESITTQQIYTLPSNGCAWLKDPAYASRNQRLDEITSLTPTTRTARAGVFSVIDRPNPVVVAARRQGWTADLVVTTSTIDQREGMYELLSRGQVLLLSLPPLWGARNTYVHVGDVVETRLGLAANPSRSWTLPLTAVDRPSTLATMPQGMRWIDVQFKYATWQDLSDAVAADGLTWDQLMEMEP